MIRELKKSFLVVNCLIIIFIIEAIILGALTLKFDLFIFCQIFVYLILIFLALTFSQAFIEAKEGVFILNAFTFALLIRSIAVIVNYWLFWELQGGPFQYGWVQRDDYTYHTIAMYFAQNPDAKLDNVSLFGLPQDYSLYPYFVGFLYRFIYPHTLVARFVNAIIGSFALVPFYLFIKNFGMEKKVAKLATIFCIFSPGFIYFNSLQLKDTLLILICFTLLYIGSILCKTRGISKFILLTLIYFGISYSLFYIRIQFFFLFAFFYFLFLIYNLYLSPGVWAILKLVLIGSIGFFILKEFMPIVVESMIHKLSPSFLFYEFTRYTKWETASMFGPLMPVITSTVGFFLPFPLLVHLPPSEEALYPTEILCLPVLLEIFFTSFLTLFAIWGSYKAKISEFKILLIMAIVIYIGLVISNFITYERIRLLLTAFCFIFIAYGIEKKGINFRRVLFICFTASLFVFLYNIIRCIAHGVI